MHDQDRFQKKEHLSFDFKEEEGISSGEDKWG